MLIEVTEAPPIGSRVEVTIAGVEGSADSPDAVVLTGDVRHHVAWQYTHVRDKQTMRGIGIRFLDPLEEELLPASHWCFSAPPTMH